ncbi:TetR/AcrR family transcriptional regulator [Actinomadura sp. 9N407]|uniref:TetR/AcrR family transcriptional regulator n=1 Tax=Actinomadura sp. 9N407 TaxID=3375154 RepID=UPI0037971AF1
MHFVVKSAVGVRRERMILSIMRAAMRLADERGFDGFTMDELAESVGVSRRTLFNHVPGKMDAVLGPAREPDPELFAAFVAGGPTGHFITDLRALAVTLLQSGGDTEAGDIARFRRLAKTEPKIMKATHDRFEQVTGHLMDVIRERERDAFDERKARLAIRAMSGACEMAFDAYLAEPEVSFVEHFEAMLDALADLFR